MFSMISSSTNHFDMLVPSDIPRIEPSSGRGGPVNGHGPLGSDRELYRDHAGFPIAAVSRPNELDRLLDDRFRARFSCRVAPAVVRKGKLEQGQGTQLENPAHRERGQPAVEYEPS